MIILGIDPGSRNCGIGLIETDHRKITAAGCDVIKIKSSLSLPERILLINTELEKTISEYKPEICVIESIFYGKNINSAFVLGHIRGSIMLTMAMHQIKIAEYSPREVKQSIVGNGNAAKKQVTYMVQQILKLKNNIESEDAADALAVALCYFNKNRFAGLV